MFGIRLEHNRSLWYYGDLKHLHNSSRFLQKWTLVKRPHKCRKMEAYPIFIIHYVLICKEIFLLFCRNFYAPTMKDY